MNKNFSEQMFAYTERIGMYLPLDTHRIIKHRYQVASNLSSGKKALEVGVGQGFGLHSIGKSAKQYTGLEYSKENLALIKTDSYQVIWGDAHDMPFEESSFDIVNALAMIYYLDLEKFLKEIRRVLNLNGILFFCTSNKNIPGFVPSPHTSNYYSVQELSNILKKHGFESKFYGSFPKYKKFKNLEQLKALLKNLIKKIVLTFPFGRSLWKRARQELLGGLKILPNHFDDIFYDEGWKNDFNKLSNSSIDSQYRIIYCVAELANK